MVQRYASYVLPPSQRAGRWSLTMAWYACASAMIWLVLGGLVASLYGTLDALIGLAVTIASFGVINTVLARRAARTGLNVTLWSRSLFGSYGSALASLIFAATATYCAVFEGSVIAVAFHEYFGGPQLLWYAIIVVYALPLVLGGVQRWLDRVNGWLLPFYVAGLVAAVVATIVQQGWSTEWLTLPAPAPEPGAAHVLPGWLSACLIYMGIWIMMMFTVDYARFGKPEDERFHGHFTFGWVFYFFTYGVNGVVGIFLIASWQVPAINEAGLVTAIIKALGLAGLLFVLVSQTRINTTNYYLASTNLGDFVEQVFRVRLPRIVWILVAGACAFALMTSNVLNWLTLALSVQGVFIVAWVTIALVHIAITAGKKDELPEVRPSRLKPVTLGAAAWLISVAVGIPFVLQEEMPLVKELVPLITVVLAGGIYFVFSLVVPPASLKVSELEPGVTLDTSVSAAAAEPVPAERA